MHTHSRDPLSLFRLKPLKAARVSEISETTASSSAAPEERVNFHIGNPIQDERLASAYLRIVLGIDIRREDLSDANTEEILKYLEWDEQNEPKLSFLRNLIHKSAPYTPRGGFARNNPNNPVKVLSEWLQSQPEPLSYDLGQTSGRREIILATGGVEEALRVLFHALSSFLVEQPLHVFLHHARKVVDEQAYRGLAFTQLPDDEQHALGLLGNHFVQFPQTPTLLIMGSVLGEEARRSLRQTSLELPLLFIEANDAPNHLSLAREAKLTQRVVRILTPAIFQNRFRELATVFLAGNADILAVFESTHFQLKGTPSASEIELLSYLLENRETAQAASHPTNEIIVEPSYQPIFQGDRSTDAFSTFARLLDERLDTYITKLSEKVENRIDRISGTLNKIADRAEDVRSLAPLDAFAEMDAGAFLGELVRKVDSPEWQRELEQSFLRAFLKHHPEYEISRSVVVSGSSRSALGLLGFHCGIREVVVPDLSWSYEHCFPVVHPVPLTPSFALDVDAMIGSVRKQLSADERWNEYGAVVLNNPHNATGRIFHEGEIKRLLGWLLDHGVWVIDDLSYQEVAPADTLPHIKTVRQLADELVAGGRLVREQTAKVVTVHSVSKTDSLAGARLAVVEIRHRELHRRFVQMHHHIRPNLGAIALTYLFYRSETEIARSYWRLRNHILRERTDALLEAVKSLPRDRNPFEIDILPPAGSLYPLLVVHQLPSGLSLDWLASGLARQGIGMLPLSTFARTEHGFDTGRKTFRLTLGGADGAEILLKKTRRVLIDLNRLIAEESARYNRLYPALLPEHTTTSEKRQGGYGDRWNDVEQRVLTACRRISLRQYGQFRATGSEQRFSDGYAVQRLIVFKQRGMDRFFESDQLIQEARANAGKTMVRRLEQELYKDSLERRDRRFRQRASDRTVHPTQMYSIQTERCFEDIIAKLVREELISPSSVDQAAQYLLEEYLGMNVAITSSEESDELILDLRSMIAAESAALLRVGTTQPQIMSFWGDWDGSNRPSGQGHRLVASVLIENVRHLAKLLSVLLSADKAVRIDPELAAELQTLAEHNRRFTKLLNDITDLTHQLEKRYRGILPFSVRAGAVRNVGMKLRLARDPLTLLWQHNDRLERKMVDLRIQRRETLEYYFSLNKKLRKQLFALIAAIQQNIGNDEVLGEASFYRDLLRRMVITPRIDQAMITAQDSFAIDTTVHNIYEINEIAAKYGTPGIILALQVSMSTQAEALITVDRKLRARREQVLRNNPGLELPVIQLIPLFEDLESVRSIPSYLTKIWDYALQSRRVNQETADRFAEVISEVFIAGSDLSQQVGQAAGAALYRQAKHATILWLAEHQVIERVRIKLGSGEPMQRQGGYYAGVSGEPAFVKSPSARQLIASHLPAAARKSTEYATTPLMGIFTSGDLRTLQSTISEQLRYLPVEESANVHYHMRESQRRHRNDLIRAAESLVESRLQQKKRGAQELERLTVGTRDAVYDQFITLLTEDFRQILYGREEDVVGVHIISYFIARTMPQLRDRPTIRPTTGAGSERGQRILERIAKIIPLSRHGSRLRAIAHNQAQTAVLGLNQLTTGLFRALDRFRQLEFKEGDSRSLIADRLLPNLPVYEMLHTLRIYHDPELTFLKRIEPAFPAGISAFLALREDNDSLPRYVGLLQQELLRRHGLDVNDFFENGTFIRELLPTLRPDLAVLLQGDLFNTDAEKLSGGTRGSTDEQWQKDVDSLLAVPGDIRSWRAKIWDLLENPIMQRVQSFVELAVALNTLSLNQPLKNDSRTLRAMKLSSELSHFFTASNPTDDMRQFLASALNYLGAISEGMVEVPVAIVRSLKEVEKIAKIEEQALSPEKQQLLRFYMLQIARLAGENG
ncbi:MAG: pyridoxal phosphate-dependent aminotransferase [Ignavibacteriales bacterium]|nr:pyridoxal phosphate-dependent aminotransferase [Ignavibacteriales bacterium]